MKCPKNIRDCPHGWTDCNLCANLKACQDGTYVPEPEPEPEAVNELMEDELEVDLGQPIPSERGTWAQRFLAMSENDRWRNQKQYIRPDDLISKEPYKHMVGAIAPGGSKSGKRKKSKKGTKIPIEPWTSQV